jgi:hypothetical protein
LLIFGKMWIFIDRRRFSPPRVLPPENFDTHSTKVLFSQNAVL